jgi:hypothetical protein
MKTTIAELIEINDRNIKKLEKLSEKETDRFFHGMLTYAQSFHLDLHRFKKLEKGIIETIYQETCKGNPEPLNLTQSCENKEYNYANRINEVNILNNNMKQTAVEWLVANIDWQLLRNTKTHYNMIVEKAKEMEKNQIIKFADEYEEYSVNTPDLKQVDTAEEYYYKKNK